MAIIALIPATFVCAAIVPEGLWEPRGTEVYNLEAGESVQFHVYYRDLPVRSWILTVEGGQELCDVNVLRWAGKSMLYHLNDESHHRIKIPWGRDEAVAVTITADTSTGGSYTVKFLAPPPEMTERSYGFTINRALEALDQDDTARAESLMLDVIRRDDEDAGIAYLLLASLLQSRSEMEKAAGMLDMALQKRFPSSLEDVELELKKQLAKVQNRLSPALIDVDKLLAEGDGRTAAYRIRVWLEGSEERAYSDWESCEAHRRLGHASHLQGDLVRAQEYLDLALREARTPGQKALVYYRLGLLLLDRDNTHQAKLALEAAHELGLPPDLKASTEDLLNRFNEE